jgi:hypothetical protein
VYVLSVQVLRFPHRLVLGLSGLQGKTCQTVPCIESVPMGSQQKVRLGRGTSSWGRICRQEGSSHFLHCGRPGMQWARTVGEGQQWGRVSFSGIPHAVQSFMLDRGVLRLEAGQHASCHINTGARPGVVSFQAQDTQGNRAGEGFLPGPVTSCTSPKSPRPTLDSAVPVPTPHKAFTFTLKI